MAIYNLQPNETKLIKTSSRYFNLLTVAGAVSLSSPNYNVKSVRVKSGWQVDLEGIPEVFLENHDPNVVEVEAEDAGIRISLGGGGGVTVENKPTIRRIEEAIQVTASATVSGGTVSTLSNDILNPLNVLSIQPNERVLLAAAREATGRKVTIQVISEPTQAAPRSVLHIGNDATIDNTKGVLLVGSINAIASAEFDTESAIYVYNDSDSEAKITGVEQYSTRAVTGDTGGGNTVSENNLMPNAGFINDTDLDGVPNNWSASDASAVTLSETNLASGNTATISNQG